jgi:nitroreductase/uncharacterized protein YciI
MHFLLFYDYVDDILTKREPHRPAHLAKLQELAAAGTVLMAGAAGDPVVSAVIVFRGDSASVVEDFVRSDPYAQNGLVKSWRVEPWSVVVGGAPAGDAPARLSMPIGEAMWTQRAIRRLRPDPISDADLRLILEAATKAPSGGNQQWARFLAVTDRDQIREFGALYHEAWWAKRRDFEGWTRPEDIPPGARVPQSARRLADEIGGAPAIVFVLAQKPGPANSVITCAQNLMLAARALGIGSVPTTLHPQVMDRFNAMFGIPRDVEFHFCIPLGYPRGRFGPLNRRPAAEVSYRGRWGEPLA